MTRILCTFPGRSGDLIWALPSIRAISESYGVPVDLQCAGEFASMVDLLLQQPYLAGVVADPRWSMSDGWEAPALPQKYDRVIHLGYRRWPELSLPREVEQVAVSEGWLREGVVDLGRPWITVSTWAEEPPHLAIGWTDCHFELKYGLTRLLAQGWTANHITTRLLAAPGSRWVSGGYPATSWVEAAQGIDAAEGFLGDCSALHVLACALGKPVVCYEPMEARWNPIFYPYGKVGPQVTLVVGNDGLPTCDARHTADTLKAVLNAR